MKNPIENEAKRSYLAITKRLVTIYVWTCQLSKINTISFAFLEVYPELLNMQR